MSATPRSPQRIVRYTGAFGLSTLFRPLPKAHQRPVLDVRYAPKDGGGPVLHFSARQALGIPEQTLLLVLLELAGEQLTRDVSNCRLNGDAQGVVARSLWRLLYRGGDDMGDTLSVRFETSWYELNQRCGATTCGRNQQLRRAQLQRLCEVTVWESEQDGRNTTRQSYLVAWVVGDDARLHLALNFRLAAALLGEHYVQVSLTERLALPNDLAMAIHAFLATVVRQGHHLIIGIDSLVDRLWVGSTATAREGSHRRRRKEVRAAVSSISTLAGWSVEWIRDDLVRVQRGRGVRESTMPRANANETTFFRERPDCSKASQDVASRAIDVSGLFLTKA